MPYYILSAGRRDLINWRIKESPKAIMLVHPITWNAVPLDSITSNATRPTTAAIPIVRNMIMINDIIIKKV